MSSANALTPLDPADYDAIEAAVMETARGRWFLAEYARRNRNADTQMLLSAIGKLEEAISGERAAQDIERLRYELGQMARSIARAKSEIAALRPNGEGVTHLEEATEALDAIVRTTERATSEILESAETIQETAWTLRERDVEEDLCDVLDRRATDIYTACSFQDLTAQRITKVVQVLRYLEGRINAMIDIWGGLDSGATEAERAPEAAPLSGIDITMSQSDIDEVIVDEDLFERDGIDGVSFDASPTLGHPIADGAGLIDSDVVFVGEDPTVADAATGPDAIALTAMEPGEAAAVLEPIPDMPSTLAARMRSDEPVKTATAPEESSPVDPAETRRRQAFAAIDTMLDQEKLQRFT